MTQDEIISMAREAGFVSPSAAIHQLERFFNLAFAAGAAHERVRTKDLTDKQIEKVWNKNGGFMGMPIDFARAVIAADREKNRG